MLHQLNSDFETVTLNCAEAIAEYVHFGQVDKQGRPYIEHVQRVAKACQNLSLDQRIAAILHDVVEDQQQKINLETISQLFGRQASHLVETLTRGACYRMGETYPQYIDRIALVPLAVPIKLADLTDNLDPTRGPIPDSLRNKYENAASKLLAPYIKRGLEGYLKKKTDDQGATDA